MQGVLCDKIVSPELLRTTTMTIAEVGYELGIDNPPYFTRLFHRCTGVTPSTFRGKTPPDSANQEAPK